MRPKKHETTMSGDLFRARLDQIINLKHELVQLAAKIDWAWIDGEIAPLYSDKGRPGIETRFVIGLLLLKHIVEAAFQEALARASQIRSQQQRQRGWKLYSFHASEVECIGKGKARAPYEFGVKVSITATNACAPAGQFVLHAKALPGNPYDGHTLRHAIEGAQRLTGCDIERAYVDKGYRGHDAPNPRRVFISGQKRGVFGVIKRELRRRSAIEPLIGHMKEEGHLGRCYLKGFAGDAANAVLCAVGYNFRRILAWLKTILRSIFHALLAAFIGQPRLNPAS